MTDDIKSLSCSFLLHFLNTIHTSRCLTFCSVWLVFSKKLLFITLRRSQQVSSVKAGLMKFLPSLTLQLSFDLVHAFREIVPYNVLLNWTRAALSCRCYNREWARAVQTSVMLLAWTLPLAFEAWNHSCCKCVLKPSHFMAYMRISLCDHFVFMSLKRQLRTTKHAFLPSVTPGTLTAVT